VWKICNGKIEIVCFVIKAVSQPDEDYSNLLTLSVPDEDYSNLLALSVPDEDYSNLLTLRVPDENIINIPESEIKGFSFCKSSFFLPFIITVIVSQVEVNSCDYCYESIFRLNFATYTFCNFHFLTYLPQL
jgi:hypothetical protein